MPSIPDTKVDFVSSLLQKQQSATNQQTLSHLEGYGSSGMTGSTVNKFGNQLINYAMSDVNIKSLRSPTNLSGSNNGSLLLSGSFNYKDLTHRTNVQSRFQPMPNDQMSNKSHLLQTPQSQLKGSS